MSTKESQDPDASFGKDDVLFKALLGRPLIARNSDPRFPSSSLYPSIPLGLPELRAGDNVQGAQERASMNPRTPSRFRSPMCRAALLD